VSRHLSRPIFASGYRLTEVVPALLLVLLAALLVFLSSFAHSTITWRGDFETNSLSQWAHLQAKDPSRVTMRSDIVRQGRYAARFEVRPGDNNVAGSGTGERTQVYIGSSTTDAAEGREQYWAWSTYIPSDFKAPMGGWNALLGFHHTGTTGGGNLQVDVRDMSRIGLRVMGADFDNPIRKDYTLAPLEKGRWYDFVLHIKWSSDPTIGFVEVWVNGSRVVPKTITPTLYYGQGVYLKLGYYRAAYSETTVVYHDGMRRGSTYEEVAAEFPSSTPTPAPSFGVTSSIKDGAVLSGGTQWSASPSGQTASAVAFSVDGKTIATDTTSPYGMSLDTTGLANGSHTFRVDATASDGTKASASAVATVSNVFSEPLSILQNLKEGQTVSGSISWAATTFERQVSKVEFSVDGQVVAGDAAAPYSISYDTTRVSNGTHAFAVKAYATDGTTANARANVNVANVARAVSVTQNLTDGQTVGGSISWAASTFDREVSKVEFSVDGQLVASDGAAPYAISYDTTRVANGTHAFAVKAYATDGTTATATANVNVANSTSAPEPEPGFSLTQNVSSGQQLSGTHEWVAWPAGKSVTRVTFWVDGRKIANENHSPYEKEVDTRRYPDGRHDFRVTALARDGSDVSTSATVTIANESPGSATPLAPAPPPASPSPPSSPDLTVSQNVANGETLSGSVSWTASPSGQSVSKIEFWIDGNLRWSENLSPYVYGGDGRTLDTRDLANGSHTLEVRAFGTSGSTTKASVGVKVSNTTPELVSSIKDGQTITGLVSWTIDPDGFSVSKMEFFIDDKLMWTERLSPWVYGGDGRQLDTRTLTKGAHVLEVRVTGTDGGVRRLTLRVTVS
jgi:Polysaccharide lyase/Bacterial Ig domain